jgi:hypothetical protein
MFMGHINGIYIFLGRDEYIDTNDEMLRNSGRVSAQLELSVR